MEVLPTLGDFNVFIIGPSNVGKTTFIQKHATGNFTSTYIPTTTTQTTSISFHVSGDGINGLVNLTTHDHASEESWGEADAAIFMFDLDKFHTLHTITQIYQNFQSANPLTPIFVVGNKYDLLGENLLEEGDSNGIFTSLISSKTNYNYEKPFLQLIRQLLDNDSLEFEDMPSPAIPILQVPPHLQELALQELEVAGVTDPPDIPDIEENDFSEESENTISDPSIGSHAFVIDLSDFEAEFFDTPTCNSCSNFSSSDEDI